MMWVFSGSIAQNPTLALSIFVTLGACVGILGFYAGRSISADYEELDAVVAQKLTGADGPVEFEPPEITMTPLDYIRAGTHLKKQRKAAKRGWVKWFRIGSNWKRPKWVKPKQDGSGAPKYEVDGQPYYFTKDAMLSDEQTGAWVAVHREGESDPINLKDPAYPGIEADLMERIINLEAESEPAGFLDDLFGMDQTTMMWVGIGLLFILFAAYRYMG